MKNPDIIKEKNLRLLWIFKKLSPNLKNTKAMFME